MTLQLADLITPFHELPYEKQVSFVEEVRRRRNTFKVKQKEVVKKKTKAVRAKSKVSKLINNLSIEDLDKLMAKLGQET